MSPPVSSPTAPTPGPEPLHAVQVLGGGPADDGDQVRSLVAGLVARGVRVTVCGPRDAEETHGFRAAGAHFLPMGPGPGATSLAALRAGCADAAIVHAHGTSAGLLASLGLPGRAARLVVSWQAAPPDQQGARAGLRRLAERHVARSARVVLAASADLLDLARERGARDARLAPIAAPATPQPPVEDPRQHKARAELGAVERPLLFTAGPLTDDQGHDVLLDAAWAWRSYDPAPLLVIAGDGPARSRLQHRITAEGLPVRLLGRRTDTADLLAAADVAVAPGRGQASTKFARDALHTGAPLVATAAGGVLELAGDAAQWVPFGEPEALARAVLGLLAAPDRRAELAAAGRARARQWPTEDESVAHVLRVYDELS
ncbi:glycosyltransferase family 4 protein [Streptomyces sp. 796.1]|uniref:glycosyltransferase family 4 protein n=1 Tax=Streptomyces sp. 796.1 TaxID=3163029 RepID=UPI0039C93B00